jgi:hypothetical protein
MSSVMNLLSARSPARPDGLPMLLVAVNLLLLSFFVLLNALSSEPTSKTEQQAGDVLARVREGYNQKAADPREQNGTLPREPVMSWAEAMTSKVQGVMINRVQLQTEVLQADASRVVIRMPLDALFAGENFIGAELVQALALASQGAQLTWQLAGPSPAIVAQGAAVAAVAGGVALVPGPPEVRLVLIPAPATTPTVGNSLNNLADEKGARVQGEAAR